MDKSELIDMEYDGRVNHTTEGIMHRLTATNTPMVRYTRTIFRHMHSVALSNGLHGSVQMDRVASPPWNTHKT